MINSTSGVVHGNSIQCDRPLGLPDGQEVRVTIQPNDQSQLTQRVESSEGLKRAAGGWDDDPDGLDGFVEWNREQRKQGRRTLNL